MVDGPQCLCAGKADSKHAEVALQARVDGEASGSRIHAGHILHVVDLLQS